MEQNFCCLLHLACLYITVSPCIHTVGTHAPAGYSGVAACQHNCHSVGRVWPQPGLSCIVLTWGMLEERGGRWGLPWSRISATICDQPVYTTVSTCIHRHTVGTRAPAAYSDAAANIAAVLCKCAHSDCPSWLSSISIIFQAHLRASSPRLCWLPSCTEILLMVALNYSVQEHMEQHMPDNVGLAYAHPNKFKT